MVTWDAIDTVLLDMDGTLLDLYYDNTLWNKLLPTRYSEANAVSLEEARAHLFAHMQAHLGKLHFYCIDYWAQFTGLDVAALHAEEELVPLIRYRPGAERFLDWLRANGKRSILITNAHRASLDVKNTHSQLVDKLDVAISCHDYGAPKESPVFWERLMREHPYDPARTLFIDDNDSVLRAADAAGVHHLITVSQPDSGRPLREGLNYPAFNDFVELLPAHD